MPASFRVGIRSVTFTDPTRTTLDYNTGAVISDDRVITTEIRYPTLAAGDGPEIANAAPASQYGPYPVIVFAHGYAVMPDTYQQMLDSWVEAGFVVVAPVFPVSNYYEWQRQGAGSAPEDDLVNQPADVAFVVRSLAARGGGGVGAPLRRAMDLRKLALAGQSDGGTTVGGLEFYSTYRDSLESMGIHPLAVALMSAGLYDSGGSYGPPPVAPALLEVQSDSDTCNTTGVATLLYNQVAPHSRPAFFLTLHGADHIGPYEDQLPWAPVVRSVTTEFFELELGSPLHQAASVADLLAVGNTGQVSSMSATTSISLPPTTLDLDGCGLSQPGPAAETGEP